VTVDGKYYHVHDAILLPRPKRPGGPPILIGGNGALRTLPLAARYADEWNAVFLTPERFAERSAQLDALLVAQGRRKEAVRRSMMAGCVFGRDLSEVEQKAARRTKGKATPQQLRAQGLIVGTAGEIADQIRTLDAAGVQRVMLQWLDLEDWDGLERMAREIL
jgi:alkanesulfonate monooxygenase SsuD/methylene tetrahydromethanopterin reductase-like flavin-dependent oxidoreductase (luciferase family)